MNEKPSHEALEKKIRALENQIRILETDKQTGWARAAIVDAMIDGILVLDSDGRVVATNQAYLQKFGVTFQEVSGKGIMELPGIEKQKNENLEKFIPLFEDTLELGSVGPIELTITTRDDKVIPISITGGIVRDQAGSPTQLVAVIRDISARKKAEDALRVNEARFRQLFESMSSGVAIFDVKEEGRDFFYKEFNRAGENMDGERRENLIGKSIFKARPSIEEFGLVEVMRNVWKTGRPEKHPATFYRDERLSGWYENYVFKLSSGEVVTIFDDVTDRKISEDSLRESERKWRLLIKTMNEGFVMVDENAIVKFTNDRFCRMLGWQMEEIVGFELNQYLDSGEKSTLVKQLAGMGKNQPRSYETVLRGKDGNKRAVIISPTPVYDENGLYRGSYATITDITDLKLTEQTLKDQENELEIKARELEELNAALKILIKDREQDKTIIEEKVLSNIREIIFPYLEKLKASNVDRIQESYLNILGSNLNEIIAPFSRTLSSKYLNFTATEMQVANLVRNGRSTKDIAELLNISKSTVDTHRNNIRKKLGIVNQKANLRTHLLSLQ